MGPLSKLCHLQSAYHTDWPVKPFHLATTESKATKMDDSAAKPAYTAPNTVARKHEGSIDASGLIIRPLKICTEE